MSKSKLPIQQKPQLVQIEKTGSDLEAERQGISELLNLDVHGQMDPIKQGKHLLSEIESELKGKTALQQGMKTPGDLLEAGEQVNLDFEEMVINIAGETEGAALLPGIKNRDRIRKKMDDEYEGDANDIRDVVRGSIVFDSLESLYKAVARVHSSAKILYVKDRFDQPRSSGYRDLKFNLEMKTPDGKLYVVELQFHLKEMLDFKEWETSLYKERRGLEEKLKQMRIREGDPPEIRRIEEKIAYLQYESQSVYGQVWKKYTKGTNWEN